MRLLPAKSGGSCLNPTDTSGRSSDRRRGLAAIPIPEIRFGSCGLLDGGDEWLAVARQIKKLNPAVPIIMLSGLAELPGETIGIANRWIIKGRSTQDLLDAIAALTRQ